MILTYKYKLKDKSAKKRLRQHAISLNQVWNFCVHTQRECERYYRSGAAKRRWPTHFDLQKLTAGSSKELNTQSGAITEICRVFAESRDKCKRAPRFRVSFGPKRNLGWVPFRSSDRQIDHNGIKFLGKLYRMHGIKRRPLPEIVKSGSFVEDTLGDWWVCLHVEIAENLPTGKSEVGIDLGLKTLATMSNGAKIENLRHQQTWAHKLAVAQRAHNKRRVKTIHRKIKNCRHDHLHKASCQITRDNALVVVGNVNSSQLVKTKMAKSVLDVGWATFKDMLSYKARRHSALFLEVDEKFTTVTCSVCGTHSGPKGIAGLRIREWVCSVCGSIHDRDVNSAMNILIIGRSVAPLVGVSWLAQEHKMLWPWASTG
jgi:putative transposase